MKTWNWFVKLKTQILFAQIQQQKTLQIQMQNSKNTIKSTTWDGGTGLCSEHGGWKQLELATRHLRRPTPGFYSIIRVT